MKTTFERSGSRIVPVFASAAALAVAACGEPPRGTGDGPGARPEDPAPRPVPELLNRVTNAYPAWSPDGEWIAYMSTADGDFDVYAVSPSRGVRRQLTDAENRDGTPAWSPDGGRIAFQSFRDGHSQIYVMNADGSDPSNVSRSDSHDEHPSWSADGERLLFASGRGATAEAPDNVDIFEMRADGTDVRRITDTPEIETYPSWSPDGRSIAVRKILEDGNWEIVVMNADGEDPRVVAPHPAIDGWPVWSPDGGRIVFSSERAGTADLWLVELAGGEPRRLTWDDEADERQPWISPDGRRVAYARYRWFPDQPFYEASEILVVELPVVGTAAAHPPARAHHRLVSHPDGVLLAGGSTRTDFGYAWFDDAWTYRGGAWTRGGALPLLRSSHALAYDEARDEIVLVGGMGPDGEAEGDQLLVRTAAGWESRSTPPGEGWVEPDACYDAARARVVVFGGWDREQEFRGDTWEWDGARLARVSETGPTARAGHGMAWDPVSRRCLLFGGRGEDGLLPDTWAWDGEAWHGVSTDGPSARWLFGMATAGAWDRVVLFGGAAASEIEDLSDTWTWDGSDWHQVDTEGPPARGMSRIAFDGERIVLFGGRGPGEGSQPFVDLADTWTFDGSRWVRSEPPE